MDYSLGYGVPTPVLAEGLASIHSGPTLLGPSGPGAPRPLLDQDIQDVLDGVSYPDDWFSPSTAGHFVSYLIERYGLEMIHKLQIEVGRDANRAKWDAAFSSVLGDSFDVVLAGYAEYPLCSWNQFRSKLWECEGESDLSATPAMDPTSISIDLSCSNNDAVGSHHGKKRAALRLHVPDPGPDEWGEHGRFYRIDVRRPGSGSLLFGLLLVEECGVPCSGAPKIWSFPDGPENLGWQNMSYRMSPGIYALVLFAEGEVTLTVEPTHVDRR